MPARGARASVWRSAGPPPAPARGGARRPPVDRPTSRRSRGRSTPSCAASSPSPPNSVASVEASSRCASSATAPKVVASPSERQSLEPQARPGSARDGLRAPTPTSVRQRQIPLGLLAGTPPPACRPRRAPPARDPLRPRRRETQTEARGGWRAAHRSTTRTSCPRAAASPSPSSRPPARGESPRPDTRVRPTTRRRSCAGRAPPAGRCVAARARAGPRTGGGSETRSLRIHSDTRTRPRPQAPARIPSGARAPRQPVGQRTAHPLQQRGPQQQPADFLPAGARAPRPAGSRPPRAHGPRSLTAKRSGSGWLASDRCRQSQPRRPPLGSSRPATRARRRTAAPPPPPTARATPRA